LQNPYCIIYNFPQLSFLDQFRKVYLPNSIAPEFFYIGQISLERAFDTLIAGLALLKTKYPGFIMHLFGESQLLKGELDQLPGYECVRDNLRFYGYTDQKKAFQYIGNVTAGLALLKPVGDYTESYPTKLFEYMALGLPVVTSNFRLYKDVVERHNCGFCISPHDPVQVAQVLIELIENPQKAFMMGLNGRQAVEHEYNWSSELEKLLNYYTLILGKRI
jgi:glycosyltransferase involved in cell wall biosynthesis